MSKVLTFSTKYPTYHPKKGIETFFVEKIAKSLHKQGMAPWDIPDNIFSTEAYYLCEPKEHTIRAGKRWKVGDKFSPRVWSGKPYASKQIIIAPDITVVKTWDFEMDIEGIFFIDGKKIDATSTDLPKNDGLSSDDFLDWFYVGKHFSGQVISWNNLITY